MIYMYERLELNSAACFKSVDSDFLLVYRLIFLAWPQDILMSFSMIWPFTRSF